MCVSESHNQTCVCVCVQLVCAYFLQELAELSSFGVSGAQILFGCHHCADTTPICILSRAVHLPPFLWPDSLCVQKHRLGYEHTHTEIDALNTPNADDIRK